MKAPVFHHACSSSRALCAAFCIAFLSAAARAQSTPGRLLAARVDVAPIIDGKAGDPAWITGPVSSDFRDFAPTEGVTPSLRTETRIRYDDRALYILVRAFDPHPDSIVRRLSRRDTFDATADQISSSSIRSTIVAPATSSSSPPPA